MSSTVALLLSLYACGDHIPNFREFYAKNYYQRQANDNWAGSNRETMTDVILRLTDAQADYLDYRLGIMEKCK